MHRILVFALLTIAFYCAEVAHSSDEDPDFACPDEHALQLLAIAYNGRDPSNGFANPVSAYTYVIENAKRPMDEVALGTACFGLAQYSYMADRPESFGPGTFNNGPPVPPKAAVESLIAKHPILERCPENATYATQLPTRRPLYEPPENAVKRGINGWVDLELNVSDSGAVESAQVISSSDTVLESGVIEHVLKFHYPNASHYNGLFMNRDGFKLRITTHYFHIARAKGCKWQDPRGGF